MFDALDHNIAFIQDKSYADFKCTLAVADIFKYYHYDSMLLSDINLAPEEKIITYDQHM